MNRFLVKTLAVGVLAASAHSESCTSDSCQSLSADSIEAESVNGAALLATATRKASIKQVEEKPDKSKDGASKIADELLGDKKSKKKEENPKLKDTKNSDVTKEGPIPGAKDKNGPKAIGPPHAADNYNPFLKWFLVAITMTVGASPVALFAYFLVNPGDMDSSREAIEEHGGPIPFAVRRTSDKLHRCGHVFFRVGMFIVYFWFGILKVFGISPAEPLVQVVFRNMPFLHVTSAQFFCAWVVGGGECIMAIAYILTLVPDPSVRFWSTAISICIGMGHLVTCSILPCVLLPSKVWQEGGFPYALTFEGQYIMKNIILISGFMLMGSDLTHPDDRKKRP
eukprot:TRINITY_DN83141_c0_g1_i1.p1 TRINITY_DN83141_c0_g1~~TRINITY_DN83141_c0_g1_i1.p1  ORF type:complete len:339 (-),score=57.47 TRINITY_DN83141_c0_g1_i1:165-1181(-)